MMVDEKRFATPEEVKARQERLRRGIAELRKIAARKRAMLEQMEDEGVIPQGYLPKRF